MARYRCYFFGANGQLVGADTIMCDGDNEARVQGRQLFARRAHATSFELRQGSRLVDTLEAKPTGAARAA
jgi:hypothetical protein